MKRKKVKRLHENEVALVAEMQTKIIEYERFLDSLFLMIKRKEPLVALRFSAISECAGEIWTFVKNAVQETNEK